MREGKKVVSQFKFLLSHGLWLRESKGGHISFLKDEMCDGKQSIMVSSLSQGGEQCDIISILFHTVKSVCAAVCAGVFWNSPSLLSSSKNSCSDVVFAQSPQRVQLHLQPPYFVEELSPSHNFSALYNVFLRKDEQLLKESWLRMIRLGFLSLNTSVRIFRIICFNSTSGENSMVYL